LKAASNNPAGFEKLSANSKAFGAEGLRTN
jgi:hypothetical protein